MQTGRRLIQTPYVISGRWHLKRKEHLGGSKSCVPASQIEQVGLCTTSIRYMTGKEQGTYKSLFSEAADVGRLLFKVLKSRSKPFICQFLKAATRKPEASCKITPSIINIK